jgi:hypothetical protein
MSITVTANVTTVNATVEPTSVLVSLPTQVITITAGIPGPPGHNGANGDLEWELLEFDSGQLEPGKAYLYDGLGNGNFTLPPDPVNGARVLLKRFNTGNWFLRESPGQQIIVGSSTATPSTGYVHSLDPAGMIELAYAGDDRWVAVNFYGNLEVV